MPSKGVEEEVSSPNLYKSARHLSSGPGGIILKKRKKSECECLQVRDIRLSALVAQFIYITWPFKPFEFNS